MFLGLLGALWCLLASRFAPVATAHGRRLGLRLPPAYEPCPLGLCREGGFLCLGNWVFLPKGTNRTIPEFRCIFDQPRAEYPDQHPVNNVSKSRLLETLHQQCLIPCLIMAFSKYLKHSETWISPICRFGQKYPTMTTTRPPPTRCGGC